MRIGLLQILGGKLVDELSCLEGTSDMEYIRLWTREAAEQIVEDCAVEEVDCDKISPVSTSWKVRISQLVSLSTSRSSPPPPLLSLSLLAPESTD